VLNVYVIENGVPKRLTAPADTQSLMRAVWIDLENATVDERDRVMAATGLSLPTEQKISEIETSSRVAYRDDTLFLNLPLINITEDGPAGTPGSFVLSEHRLITIRFAHSRVFAEFSGAVDQQTVRPATAAETFSGLMEAIVDRQADALENASADLERISHTIFKMGNGKRRARKAEDAMLRQTLGELGRISDLLSHIRDTQIGVKRIVGYAVAMAAWLSQGLRHRLAIVQHDVESLNDFDKQLADKMQFLLDATLGFINIAQNDVMKVMAIASVAGIPPVLIVGVYGMNFKDMPELEWAYGYGWAWFLIILTTLIPMAAFRWKRWI